MGIDAATWQALGLVLTVLGLGLSAVIWARRGPAKGLRGVAWSLLPLAAGLTGVLRLAWEIGDSVLSWAARLVFSPVVWLGLVVAGVAVVLFVVSGWMLRRGGGGRGGRGGRRGHTDASAQVTTPAAAALPRTGRAPAGTAGDDMTDIEEILRKHGIR